VINGVATAPLQPPGLASRVVAADLIEGVLYRRRPLDEALASPSIDALSERDRALARRIAATVLRRLATLRLLIGELLDRGLPGGAPRVESALLIGAAQILLLDTPHHAAVDLSVRLVQRNARLARYAGLANAVLRRLAREGVARLASLDPSLDIPDWLLRRWINTYGEDTARAIARASGQEPPLDLTVKAEPELWAERLGGHTLPTGSVRLPAHGPISALPGYEEGQWWVQDAAAALPVRLFGDLRGQTVLDLCAAPGGKTAQLAFGGARVTAVDRSSQRMGRLIDNMRRLGLSAETLVAEAEAVADAQFDAVLLDAPCTATGTIRRHPDIPWRRTPADIELLAAVQNRLLLRAIDFLRPGGTLVFSTCSLEPEEAEHVLTAALARDQRIRRRPINATEVPGEFITGDGDLRTLPSHWPDPNPRLAGLDGFFAARLERIR
jgi:16S rRNA (cytosine967-C5)-methyltransferase